MKGEETLKFLPSPFTQPEVLPQKSNLSQELRRGHTHCYSFKIHRAGTHLLPASTAGLPTTSFTKSATWSLHNNASYSMSAFSDHPNPRRSMAYTVWVLASSGILYLFTSKKVIQRNHKNDFLLHSKQKYKKNTSLPWTSAIFTSFENFTHVFTFILWRGEIPRSNIPNTWKTERSLSRYCLTFFSHTSNGKLMPQSHEWVLSVVPDLAPHSAPCVHAMSRSCSHLAWRATCLALLAWKHIQTQLSCSQTLHKPSRMKIKKHTACSKTLQNPAQWAWNTYITYIHTACLFTHFGQKTEHNVWSKCLQTDFMSSKTDIEASTSKP